MLLDEIKTTLRISHNKLDDEINSNISSARLEMIRLGILEDVANSDDDELIKQAIKTYCQMQNTTDDKKYERYFKAWQYQTDCLRKSKDYGYIEE